MEKKGVKTDIDNENREIMERNAREQLEKTADLMHELKQKYTAIRAMAKNIDERAEQIKLKPSNKQAENYFKKVFNIEPTEAKTEIKRLEAQAQDIEQEKEQLQAKLPALLVDKDKLITEYRKQKLLADISRDRQRILDRLERLEKEILGNLSAKNKVIYMRENMDFEGLMQGISPERQEREKEKERERERERDFTR